MSDEQILEDVRDMIEAMTAHNKMHGPYAISFDGGYTWVSCDENGNIDSECVP